MFAGQIHELKQAWAVSVLDKELFVLPSSNSTQLNVYDAADYTSHGFINIPITSNNFVDMTACGFYHCLYLADSKQRWTNENTRVVRLQLLPSKLNEWKVDDTINAVSVTSAHYLLALCGAVSEKLNLFTTDGVLHMTVELQPDLMSVNSAMELMPGKFVVAHGKESRDLHRVCVVNRKGKVLRTYGRFQGSYRTLLSYPTDVAIDKDGFVYVVEEKCNRLIVLTSELDSVQCISDVLPVDDNWSCRGLKIDKDLRRIYVRSEVSSRRHRSESCVTILEM